jgi:alanyl-tRNA synthetase
MTARLYYHDSYATRFEARVVERLRVNNHPAVVLDRTAFYPSSGGQPFDTGRLGAAQVVDVVEGPNDGAVLHVLDRDVEDGALSGEVDWSRRFDHMQQHTGQHILSRAFVEVATAHTVGFHLGEDRVNIDLDLAPLSLEHIERAEWLANEIVYANRAITARLSADSSPLAALPTNWPPAKARCASLRSLASTFSPAAARTSAAPAKSARSRS